jgi:7,8-didemethyl-8-hydroxy-5-deazariboflavin synthase CofG subunit
MEESVTISRDVDTAFDHGLGGRGICRDHALLLFQEAPLTDLLNAAAIVRDHAKGSVVSYSKKVFIPLTHLCRDYCGYCTFRSDPEAGVPAYMTPEQVLAVAEAGRRAGCKEALFSLGDQPERVFPEAKEFLNALGYESTLKYLAAMTQLVLEKTGILPHSNPGVMGTEDLRRLRESNVSVGLMLESTSSRLGRPGGAHWKAPDKVPAARLRTVEEAGRLRMPFTTGILIGIGETNEERVDSLLAIRSAHEKYGHIQEVIVQPFRAKPEIRMAQDAEPSTEGLKRTINDWGGISPVTKDFINPEAAWPQIASLAEKTASAGGVLRERLAIYPEFLARAEFIDVSVRKNVDRLKGKDGYACLENGQC